MLVSIAGAPGAGKSTVAKQLAQELGYAYYSVGEHMREIAERRNMSLAELGRLAQQDDTIDKELDDRQREFASQNNVVVDSRLGWFFLPSSRKIWLSADVTEAAKRIAADIAQDKRKGERAGTATATVEQVKHSLLERIRSEQKRYQQYYKIDPYDMNHYDVVLDTTHFSIAEVVAAIKRQLQPTQR